MSIVEFLSARLDEDEEVARTAAAGSDDPGSRAPIWTSLRSGQPGVCDHGPRGSVEMQPASVLAEVAAKREMVRYYLLLCEQGEQVAVFGYHATGLMYAIRQVAAVYADHPDYDESWRP